MRDRKFNISLAFVSKPYFKVAKDIRLNATHYFIIKILNKEEPQQRASNNSSNIECKGLMKLYKDYTKEPFPFSMDNTTLPLDNPLKLKKDLL